MRTKICTKCKTEKVVSKFGQAKHHKDGLKSHCKTCCLMAYKHKCSDCGTTIKNKNSQRCKSCATKHRYNKIGRKEFRCVDCSCKISYGHKRCTNCIKLYQVGKQASNYKGVKYICTDCGKNLKNIYAKRCSSCAHKGNYNAKFGKPPKHSCRVTYKNIKFRSYWEANFAKWLDLSGIKWLYESKTFDLGNTTYTPDFYLPEFDCYVEIKGYWYKKSKNKFNKFKKSYSELIYVFDKLKLKNIGII